MIKILISEQEVNKIKLLEMKVGSYQSLFLSYINNTVENSDTFRLQEFLDKYVGVRIEYEDFLNSIIDRYMSENKCDISIYEMNRSVDIIGRKIILNGGISCRK